jgi:DNA invertase Pin-like site-specific DNA recombinase
MTLYYPEIITDSKFVDNNIFYLIKWKGYKEQTWEPVCNIIHRDDLIDDYNDIMSISNLGLEKTGYIYCRVSSKEQSKYDEGRTSLQVQEKELSVFCDANGVNVSKVVKEVYSAKNMNRMKGLQYLLGIASRGQTIYVYDVSRFSRNIHHALNVLEELKDKGVSVVSITENITYSDINSRNQFRLQLCASNYVSDTISQKVKASIKFRRERGDYIGNTKFGFTTVVQKKTNVRYMVENKEEMRIIEFINSKQHLITQSIVKMLIKKHITFRGRTPTESGVARIIKRLDTDLKIKFNTSNVGKTQKKSKSRSRAVPY